MKTRPFETVSDNSNDTRRKVVIAIFIVIALILAAFATLIVGNLIAHLPDKPAPSNRDLTYFPKEAEDLKLGYLVSINDSFPYGTPSNLGGMVDIYTYRHNDNNRELTRINDKLTYSLSRSDIVLEESTLNAFNQMMLDYCKTLNLSNAKEESASNIVVAWGGYSEATLHEYKEDLASASLGKDFYDHILGTTLTLRTYDPSTPITEEVLKRDFAWIYENAHKYGFILRYPNSCKDHTGLDGSKRIHLRYVGEVHATYIYENNICLETYLETLRNQHNSVDKTLTVNTENGSYEVYYIKHTGNPTKVPVPKGCEYTISGDNMNGFIVTVEK